MPDTKGAFKEVLPKQGQLYQEDVPNMVLCKPKLLPLKSVTLEKLEKMQRDAQETVKQQEKEAELEAQQMMSSSASAAASSSDYNIEKFY